MSSPRGVVCLDCDGVILDMLASWESIAADKFGPITLHEPAEWDMQKRYGMDKKQVGKVWDELDWSRFDPFPGAPEAVHRIVDSGYDLAIVSGIPEEKRKDRETNLKKVLGFVPYLVLTGSGKADKIPVLQNLGAYAYVDDLWDHIERAEGAGIPILGYVAPLDRQHYRYAVPDLKTFVSNFLGEKPSDPVT